MINGYEKALRRNDTINVSVNYLHIRRTLHEFRNITRDRQRPENNDLLAQALDIEMLKDNIRGYLGGQSGGSAFNTIVNPITHRRYSIKSKKGKQLLKSYVKSLNTQRRFS